MKNQFLLFLKKARRETYIKALAVGASAALALTGGLLLAAKLLIWPLWYCLFGIAALPIGAGLFVLLHRISARKLAKRLDNTFELREKVQTMIAFEDSQEPMAVLQREDTLEKLSQIPTKKLPFARLWVYTLLPALALSLMVTALACPTRVEEPDHGPVEPPRDITDWEWKALDSLIDYVIHSEADENIMKPKTLSALRNLKSLLQNGVSESSLQSFVKTVTTQVRNIEIEASGQEGISEHQKQLNNEVCTKVVDELCSIFGIENTVEDPGEKEPDDKKDDDEEDGPGNGSSGTGNLEMASDERLFDELLGYVRYAEVFNTYYQPVLDALDNGMIAKDEWAEYLMDYFERLSSKKD